MTLTPAVRKRLDKLATWHENLPEDYGHFDMKWWLTGATSKAELRYARHNGGVESCGTAACFAGGGPAAGVHVPQRFVYNLGVDWLGYANWLAGGEHFNWLFGGRWRYFDNTPRGAAARARYLLEHSKTPDGFLTPGKSWLPHYAPFLKEGPPGRPTGDPQ